VLICSTRGGLIDEKTAVGFQIVRNASVLWRSFHFRPTATNTEQCL
jgi:hypothetical protein